MLIVLKYGGNAMSLPSAPEPLLDELAERAQGGDRIVLVHGGGPQIDEELRARGIAERRVAGLRVTDAATLAVVEAVLCGRVNKALVRALLARGARAVGLSGQDGGLLVARRAPAIEGVALGFVGEIERVEPAPLEALLAAGFVPVVAPLALEARTLVPLNVNADTAAGAIAGALAADAYLIVTNVARVRRELGDPGSELARLDASEARALLADGSFGGGMRPKIESALAALAAGARSVAIAGGGPGAVARALGGEGTTLVPG
ncbi:MAG: acetylglutamate kinase [Vulcanimicrobiaceae bacterium]